MTDIEAGSAPALAEPSPTPVAAEVAVQEAPLAKAEPTPRNAIDRAFEKMERDEQPTVREKQPKAEPVKTEAEPVTDASRERDENGRFKAKDPATAQVAPIESQTQPKPEAPPKPDAEAFLDPPARLTADAKAAWKDAPLAVRAEFNRTVKDLEGGLRQYQSVLEPIKPFMDLARQSGTTVQDAMSRYVGLERELGSDNLETKIQAFDRVLAYAGLSPEQYNAAKQGRTADPSVVQQDGIIQQLLTKITHLEQGFTGVQTTLKEQKDAEVKNYVTEFTKENQRLNDEPFAEYVAYLLKEGKARDLPEAYGMADKRLNPAPAEASATVAQTHAKPTADQTRKGTLSVTGAPASGSNPANRKPPATSRDALDRAFSSLGLG